MGLDRPDPGEVEAGGGVTQPPSSLSERAYEGIRDLIVSLRLPPGAPLAEDELMAELGVGRTPIREALKRLSHESLVDVFPRRGTFVSEIQITDLAAISEVREHLEGCAASLAAERYRPDEDGPGLERLLSRIEGVDDSDRAEAMEIDAEVHRFLYWTARNPYLEDTLAGYYNLSRRIWNLALNRLTVITSSTAEHRALLEAVREHDSGRARRCASSHVAKFEREMRDVL